MLEEAIRICRSQDRAEVVIAGRVVERELAHEGAVSGGVVADGEAVVRRVGEKAVHLPLVVLEAAPWKRVIGIREATAVQLLKVVGLLKGARWIRIRKPNLLTVLVRRPPEEVVKASVLHHHDHDVFDARRAGRRKPSHSQCRGRKDLPIGVWLDA